MKKINMQYIKDHKRAKPGSKEKTVKVKGYFRGENE